jgi:hypothetical protein
MYNKVTPKIIDALKAISGTENVHADDETIKMRPKT